MEVRLKRKIVFENTSDELYSIFAEKFLTTKEYRMYNDCNLDVYTDSYTDSEAMDIPIEDMKALIQKAEDAGANFIQIDWHCDHNEYNIYGSLVTRATEEEINEGDIKKSLENEKVKQAKIDNLEAELKELKNG